MFLPIPPLALLWTRGSAVLQTARRATRLTRVCASRLQVCGCVHTRPVSGLPKHRDARPGRTRPEPVHQILAEPEQTVRTLITSERPKRTTHARTACGKRRQDRRLRFFAEALFSVSLLEGCSLMAHLAGLTKRGQHAQRRKSGATTLASCLPHPPGSTEDLPERRSRLPRIQVHFLMIIRENL